MFEIINVERIMTPTRKKKIFLMIFLYFVCFEKTVKAQKILKGKNGLCFTFLLLLLIVIITQFLSKHF